MIGIIVVFRAQILAKLTAIRARVCPDLFSCYFPLLLFLQKTVAMGIRDDHEMTFM